MPWTRLDPAEIIPHLHFVHGPADQDDAAHAERDMARLRRALLTGEFIAVQDEHLATHRWIWRKMLGHHAVHHARGEYARTDGATRAHVNTAEGFFGLFKRAIVGVWHWVSEKHLRRYAAEHEFRWNRRQTDMADRVARCLIGQHGRLSWKDLTA